MTQLIAIDLSDLFDSPLSSGLFLNLLDSIPETRRNRIVYRRHSSDRIRMLAGDWIIRRLAVEKFGLEQDAIRFERSEFGKPHLVGHENLYFNLSHSGRWTVCAVSEAPIGVDIEEVTDFQEQVANLVYTSNECRELSAKQGPDRADYFYSLWVTKESFLKATGRGLSLSPKIFEISASALARKEGTITSSEVVGEYAFKLIDIDDQHRLAVCGQSLADIQLEHLKPRVANGKLLLDSSL